MTQAGWLADPTGGHEVRYWDGTRWTQHVGDRGVTAIDPLPAGVEPPAPGAPANTWAPPSQPEPPSPAVAPSGKGGWKDRFKTAAQEVAQQGKQVADQAKSAIGAQQAKRLEQWREDPATLWCGQSQGVATKATGMSKALYRITKDRVWIDTGVLGVRSDQFPLWAVKDLDVRQSALQRGKDVGDVVLWLEDPSYGVQGSAFSMSGEGGHEPGVGRTSGEAVLDDIAEPYRVRDLLMPLISEARSKKLMERQTQYLHVNPGVAGVAAGFAATPGPPAAPAPTAPPTDLADQLRKLAALRDEGILTDEEFAAQKARLLGS
jgi:hypothetical protein